MNNYSYIFHNSRAPEIINISKPIKNVYMDYGAIVIRPDLIRAMFSVYYTSDSPLVTPASMCRILLGLDRNEKKNLLLKETI